MNMRQALDKVISTERHTSSRQMGQRVSDVGFGKSLNFPDGSDSMTFAGVPRFLASPIRSLMRKSPSYDSSNS